MLLAQVLATNNHLRKILPNQKMTFPSIPMKHDIFSKKTSHGYIVVLKMRYFNQGQVIRQQKHLMEIPILKLSHQSV